MAAMCILLWQSESQMPRIFAALQLKPITGFISSPDVLHVVSAERRKRKALVGHALSIEP